MQRKKTYYFTRCNFHYVTLTVKLTIAYARQVNHYNLES